MVKNYQKIEEMAGLNGSIHILEQLNCDYKDAGELQSLQLALQLQAEETEKARRSNISQLVQFLSVPAPPPVRLGGGYSTDMIDVFHASLTCSLFR